MTNLPDVTTSRMVLVGVHTYHALEPLPAVRRNLTGLRAVFTNEVYWGLPEEHCVVLEQPTSGREVLDQIYHTAQQATDALVIYYAGHGLADLHTDELCLALPDSDPNIVHTSLRYEDIRRVMLHPEVRARRKVIILDCCYSGRALVGGMGPVNHLADEATVDGSYILTASAETRKALSPPGEDYTAFTGALIDVLSGGVAGGPELLDMDTVYRRTRRLLEAKSRPLPQQRNRNAGAQIALVRNAVPAAPTNQGTTNPVWRTAEMPEGPLRDLRDELHHLHAAAGRPSPHDIESTIRAHGGTTVWSAVYELLYGLDVTPAWNTVADVVAALGAEPAAVKSLWESTVPAPVHAVPATAADQSEANDPDNDYRPGLFEQLSGAGIYATEFHQEFGNCFDRDFFNEITRDGSMKKPAVRRLLIKRAADNLAWRPTDPYLVETPRARIIDGLLAFTEEQRRRQLTELALLAHDDPAAARTQLDRLADTLETKAIILAALGSRDVAAAAVVLMHHVDDHSTDALDLVKALATMRSQGSRAIFRHLASTDHSTLAAVLMLVEARAPMIRDAILQVLR